MMAGEQQPNSRAPEVDDRYMMVAATSTERLQSLLKSLPPSPSEQRELEKLVEDALKNPVASSSSENRKSQWEYVLKNEVFMLAATEGDALQDPETKYYNKLRDMLDLILLFTEREACEQTFPFTVLQDLLETQTITSCSHVFSWIESRAQRLTEGMVPQKGKALVLLRTLNDLLRRLSKMGSTTIFCGRILTFLSGVFPLGERSGVNLRGEYGSMWEGVKGKEKDSPKNEDAPTDSQVEGDKMQVDGGSVGKEDLYNTFWSLQLPFSKPPLFANPGTLNEFKEAVEKILPIIKEATAKERAMMGSRSTNGTGTAASLKRKRDPDVIEEMGSSEYFFAKFLTSPDLLDLELADTHFRRQFLFQLLILLTHLQTFTPATKTAWFSPRNRSLQIDFTLEPTDAQWVQEAINKATDELKQTTPNGRAFMDTVNTILEREKNWVKWKNELCAPFDREPWSQGEGSVKIGLVEATMDLRKNLCEDPKDWEWRLGSEPLTEIWEMGFRDLSDLKNPFQPGDVKDFVKKIKQEDARIEMRRKTLAQNAERVSQARAKAEAASAAAAPSQETSSSIMQPDVQMNSLPAARSPLHPSLPAKPGSASPAKPSVSLQELAPAAAPVPTLVPTSVSAPVIATSITIPSDDQILKLEENKQRWSWLALRTARDQHLQLFGKIGTGDIMLLAEEIEKEKEPEKHKGEDMLIQNGAGDDHASPMNSVPSMDGSVKAEAAPPDGDVNMDER